MNRLKELSLIVVGYVYIFGCISIASEPNLFMRPWLVVQKPDKIVISMKKAEFEVGEPILFDMVYIYDKPVINPKTGKVAEIAQHSAKLKIDKVEGDKLIKICDAPLGIYNDDLLFLTEGQNTIYKNNFIIFTFLKKLLISESGIYNVCTSRSGQISNTITLNIKPPSDMVKKALSLLSDPNDISFLNSGGGEYEFGDKLSERFLHLKNIIKECGGTTLAEMSAARLGIEYFKDFHSKHPSFVKFKEKRKKENLKEPLFEDANRYLEKAYNLPDEFPIREEVIEKLFIVEYIKDNYDEALSLIEEAAEKYPHSKLGKNAARSKEELLQARQKEKSDRSEKK